MAKKKSDLGKYLGMLGFAIAVLAPILAFLNMTSAIPYGAWIFSVWMVAVLGLVVGVVSGMKKAGVQFLLAAIALITFSVLFAGIPTFGTLVSGLLFNIGAFAGGLSIFSLVTDAWKHAK